MTIIKTAIAAIAATGIMTGAALAGGMGAKDIVDTAAANDDFETLVAAVQAAGLVETLKGEGPFTVFAPTDEAFAAIGATVEELLKPENKDRLAAVLGRGVVRGCRSGRTQGVQGRRSTRPRPVARPVPRRRGRFGPGRGAGRGSCSHDWTTRRRPGPQRAAHDTATR